MDRNGYNIMKSVSKQLSWDGLFPFKDILKMFFFVFMRMRLQCSTLLALGRGSLWVCYRLQAKAIRI